FQTTDDLRSQIRKGDNLRLCNAFGEPYAFVEMSDHQDTAMLSFQLHQRFGIPICITEAYIKGDNSPKIHLAVNLFLIAKYANVQWDDEVLIKAIQMSL
ncbi:MAG: hypothetical protein ACFFBD_26815, partial [Candidatus Hodarchaeota archaeon]